MADKDFFLNSEAVGEAACWPIGDGEWGMSQSRGTMGGEGKGRCKQEATVGFEHRDAGRGGHDRGADVAIYSFSAISQCVDAMHEHG